jgi:SUKH-3 immunity protein of toxin-antitoxin system
MLLSIGAEVRRRGQLDEALLPSPETTGILREAGWSAERRVDVSGWITDLAREGTTALPAAEAILSNFGGLVVKHTDHQGSSRHSFDLNPSRWYHARDEIRDNEELVGDRLFPLGETEGAGMLAVLEDGGIIWAFVGCISLDHLA